MQARLTAEAFAALPGDNWGEHYILQNDGTYLLKVEGAFLDTEDPQKLKNALEHVRKEKEELGIKLKALEGTKTAEQIKADEDAAKIKADADALAIKNKDLGAVVEGFELKMKEQNEAFAKQLSDRDEATNKRIAAMTLSTIEQGAATLAQDIFGDLGVTQIANLIPRLAVDDASNLVAKDATGAVMTLAALKQEILDNDVYKPIIVASKASGAGGTHDLGSPVDIGGRKFDDLSSDEKVALHREDPASYKQLQSTATENDIRF